MWFFCGGTGRRVEAPRLALCLVPLGISGVGVGFVADAKWSGHKADPSRAQEDLTNGFGVDDRGVPREWNDEYQCLLELPNDTPELVSDSRGARSFVLEGRRAGVFCPGGAD